MSDTKRRIIWGICLLLVIALSVLCLIGLQRIGNKMATEAMVDSLFNENKTYDGESIHTMWKIISQVSSAIILTLTTIGFSITCKKEVWDTKDHGLTLLIIGTVLRWIGIGLIAEILFLLAAIRVFVQAYKEK